MFEEDFAERLAQLRIKKGASARDMSLSIGQNAGYINNIETGKSLPSMSAFFYICDFLGISPREFFDTGNPSPEVIKDIDSGLRLLGDRELESIKTLVKAITRGRGRP